MSYEIHITSHLPPRRDIERQYKKLAEEEHWTTSKINGDPNLGAGAKFYFTTYETTLDRAFIKLNIMTDRMRDLRIPIIREKIEHIVFDTKSRVGMELRNTLA